MRQEFAQILGMMKYEFRMHWRRRSMWVITLAMIVITILTAQIGTTALQVPMSALAERVEQGGLTSRDNITFGILFMTWTPLAVMLAIILPIVVADTIPLDRQFGIRELLDSLPLSRRAYYSGKLFGMDAAILAGIVVATIANTIYWHFTIGVFNLGAYLIVFLLGGATLVILNGSLGVLLPAGQPNRRRAVLAIALFYVLPYLSIGDSLQLGSKATLLTYLNPFRAPLITQFSNPSSPNLNFFTKETLMAIAVGIMELGVLIALIYGWTHWQGKREG